MTDWLDLSSLGLEVDFIGRFEELSSAVSRIRQEIPGLPDLRHLKAANQTVEYKDAKMSASTRQFIEDFYRSDFEAFNYTF